MEPKKNPAFDIHRKRNVILNFSFAISLLIVITAFRWAVPVTEKNHDPDPPPMEDFTYVDDYVVAKEKQEKKAVEKKLVRRTPGEFIEAKKVTSFPEDLATDADDPEEIPLGNPEVPKEILSTDSVFIIVETMPSPVGGYEAFYQDLKKNFKYPRQAIRNETQGRVYVEFIIGENGVPGNIKVVKGIGSGCDEEAMRVIGLSKWNSGKQRGKSVRVKMVLPVTFTLSATR